MLDAYAMLGMLCEAGWEVHFKMGRMGEVLISAANDERGTFYNKGSDIKDAATRMFVGIAFTGLHLVYAPEAGHDGYSIDEYGRVVGDQTAPHAEQGRVVGDQNEGL